MSIYCLPQLGHTSIHVLKFTHNRCGCLKDKFGFMPISITVQTHSLFGLTVCTYKSLACRNTPRNRIKQKQHCYHILHIHMPAQDNDAPWDINSISHKGSWQTVPTRQDGPSTLHNNNCLLV